MRALASKCAGWWDGLSGFRRSCPASLGLARDMPCETLGVLADFPGSRPRRAGRHRGAVALARPAAGIGWGTCAGAAGGVGFMFFYAGLAAGPMSVVAPLSALVSTVLPVAVALAEGERPGPRVYAGALICVVAIISVSSGGGRPARGAPGHGTGSEPEASQQYSEPDPPAGTRAPRDGRRAARGIGYGIAAGAAFGMFFLFIRNGGESGAFWPVAVARIAGTLIVVIAATGTRTG